MKCPKCGKELEIQNRKVGVDANGSPVYNRYAICRDCKKMWNLDRQKTRRADRAVASEDKEPRKISVIQPALKKPEPETRASVEKETKGAVQELVPGGVQKRPAQDSAPLKRSAPSGRKRPAAARTRGPKTDLAESKHEDIRRKSANEKRRYSNIPPQDVRSKRAKAVKESYTSMLSLDPSSVAVKDRALQSEERTPVYRTFRVVLAVFALLLAGLFGYMAYSSDLKNLGLLDLKSPVMIYTVLASCMLLTAGVLLIFRKSDSIFAFLVPMLISLSGSLFTFMSHNELPVIKIYAVGCAVFTVILLIITITSRFTVDFDE